MKYWLYKNYYLRKKQEDSLSIVRFSIANTEKYDTTHYVDMLSCKGDIILEDLNFSPLVEIVRRDYCGDISKITKSWKKFIVEGYEEFEHE